MTKRNAILNNRHAVQIYADYYHKQIGGGSGGDRFEGVLYQRGHGFGSFFRGLMRFIRPVLQSQAVRSGAKALARQAASTGAQVMADVEEGRNFGESLKHRGTEGGRQMAGAAKRKLESMQFGSGRIKRGKVSLARELLLKGPRLTKLAGFSSSKKKKKVRKKKRSLETVF
jgi:hypothetical protein